MKIKETIENLVGNIGMGVFFLWALGENIPAFLGKDLSQRDYNVRGSPEFRREIYHQLMKRASKVEQRESGAVFIMPEGKTAVSLGKSKRTDGYGWFSLDIYNVSHFLDKKLDSCESLFGEKLHDSLMSRKYDSGLVEEDGGNRNSFGKSRINFEDIRDPRKTYITTCTITVSHEIPIHWNVRLKNPRTFSDISFAYEEG